MFRQIFVFMILMASGGGCKCSQTSSTPDYEEALQNVTKVISQAPSVDRVAMSRMTPEQMSATISDALGVDNLWSDSEYDPIVDFFGVALGGVDFQSTFERDRTTNIQTLLTSRGLAMMVAYTVIRAESARSDADKLIFSIANMDADTPSDGGDRWANQVKDLYWRLLSREPTDEEISVLSEAFIAVGTGSNVTNISNDSVSEWTGWGWVTVLYGIISTEEFWNL